jgi:MFS family permease
VARRVQIVYLLLTALATLAASLIWGINTLFLLDAGLDNTQAFAANAFFTAGQVLFEIPTGVLADTWGRRRSYLLGAATLLVATLLYFLMWQQRAPLWGWAVASILLGLGFTFFSGATEAWLVDALKATRYQGKLETVFARGQMVEGAAMLVGSVGGGVLAQATNLGTPYVARAVLLGLTLAAAFLFMKDQGFTPDRSRGLRDELRSVVRGALDGGWRNPPVRWLMLASPFSLGVSMYAFYALQPYLLELYGDKKAFGVAGLAAALVAGAQILGGLAVPLFGRVFARRTHVLLVSVAVGIACLAVLGLRPRFWVALVAVAVWALMFAASRPVRQAYVNAIVPSAQRATVLSFDNLMGSAGGMVTQPGLGRVADAHGYAASYLVCAALNVLALPFLLLARRTNSDADRP